MAEDVGTDAVARLVDEEPPRQQTQRIRSIVRQEAAAVIGDRADAAGVELEGTA